MPPASRIFISYARKDGQMLAERLDHELSAAGFNTWRDTRNINPYQDYTVELEQAIEESSHVVCCITPDTRREESFVRRELSYAQLHKKPIVPLIFQNTPPPINIVNLTNIDFTARPWDSAITELCSLLRRPLLLHKHNIQASTDPYADYLNELYKIIVSILERTITRLIELQGEATPNAVQAQSKQVLSPTFLQRLGFNSVDQGLKFGHFHEAFERYSGRVLLLGDPGSGKTTTLMAFTRDAVSARLQNSSLPLPLFIPIATWNADKFPTVLEWIASEITVLDLSTIQNLVEQGKLLLIFDGLDELGREQINEIFDETTGEYRKHKYDPRLHFVENLPSTTPVIISCRRNDYFEIGFKVTMLGAVTLQPFDDAQIKTYLNDHLDLWNILVSDNDLMDMVRTPLLLSHFTYAFSGLDSEAQNLHDLKQGNLRDKVFETFVRRRYESESSKPNVDMPFSLTELTASLSRLAIENAGDRKLTDNRFTESDFARIVGKERRNSLSELATRLNMLIQIDGHTFRFIHLLLRDYYIYQVATSYLTDKDWGKRQKAIFALGKIHDERAVPLIIEALINDPNEYVRSSAAGVLSVLHDLRALNSLVKAMRDPNENVRFQAADAVVELQDPSVGEVMLEMLKDQKRGRGVAAYVLGKLHYQSAYEHLVEMLSDKDSTIRFTVAIALGDLGNTQAVEPLISLLQDEAIHISDVAVRTYRSMHPMKRVCDGVAEALEKLGTPEALAAVEEWHKRDATPKSSTSDT